MIERIDDGVVAQALRQASLATALCTLDGRFLEVNERLCQMVGRDEAELMALDAKTVTHPDDLEITGRAIQELVTGEERSRTVLKRYLRPDNTAVWGETEVVRVNSGELVMLLVIIRELSEADVMLRRSRQQERLFRFLYENTPIMMHGTDRNGRLVYVSNMWLERLGYERDEVIGTSPVDYLTPESKKYAMETALPNFFRTGQADDVEFQMVAKSGEIVDIVFSARSARDEYEQHDMGLAYLVDVTEKRRLEAERARVEQQLEERQRLESLGVLAGGIAHDFNNILTAILGNSSIIDPSGLSDGDQHALQQVMVGAERAGALCRQLLQYAGRESIKLQATALNDVIRDMTDLVRTSIAKKTTLDVRLDPRLPAVKADPAQLQQIVLNLVINASEALNEQPGTVTVRTYERSTWPADGLCGSVHNAGAAAVLEVCDDGCGMDDGVLKRIFEPFFTTKISGRGMGLAAVIGVVRAHDGDMTVSSEPGHGTTIRVWLPLAEQAAPARSSTAERADWRGSGHVLVIDDEAAVRNILVRIFRRMGFEPETAADGVEGLEMLRRQPDRYRLVLMDYTMPKMNGLEVLELMRFEGMTVPVVLSSGFMAKELSGPEPDGFLQKPYTPKRVKTLVRSLLG